MNPAQFWKSCDGQKPSEGSNPSHSARKILETERLRGFYFFPGTASKLKGASSGWFL